ncbi:MAG: FkbM family methyltransferase [Methylacidiphilales bacterium]|nr:FkbM family methyltransferase [Candidatus Methylacidiphilales bacterium]
MNKARRLLKSLAWKLFPFAECAVKTASRLKILIPTKDAFGAFQEVFYEQCYRPNLASLSEVKRWVDVGCNIGYFSLWLYDALGKTSQEALLVDANPLSCKYAGRLLALNKLEPIMRVENALIGPKSAKAPFFASGTSTGSSIHREWGRNRKTILIPSAPLAEIVGTNSYDLIKIDIEGAEKFIFENETEFILSFPLGLAEWHAPYWSGKQMKDWLQKNKCRILQVSAGSLYGSDAFDSALGTVLWSTRSAEAAT